MPNSIGLEVRQYGFKQLLDKLSPGRSRRALDGALGLGARHLLKTIRAESRVKSGHYKGRWRQERVSDTQRNLINDAGYAEYVTGMRQSTTLPGGRRRGAGEYFMRKISREQRKVVRQIMEERIRREFQ